MKIVEGDWKTFGVRALAHGVIGAVCVVGAMHVAHAWEGRPDVETRSFFTVAGTLAGVPAAPAPTLRFTFHKVGETTPCPPIDATMVTYNGATFSAQVPYEVCGRGYFDGANITVDVAVNGTPVVTGQAVNPVPYANFASVAGQVGVNNDCPAGYDRGNLPTDTPGIVCVRNVVLGALSVRDEVVKVGVGATALWVDRYEAAIFLRADGMQLGAANMMGGGANDIASTSGLQRSGQYPRGAIPVVALSRVGMPTVNVTWFQANQACRFSGKRLMTGSEWLAAAVGTPDPTCNVSTGGVQMPSPTAPCVSSAGVIGMVGNVSEWTDEWYAGAGAITTPTIAISVPDAGATSILRPLGSDGERVEGLRANLGQRPWPSDYGDGQDRTDNVVAVTIRINGESGSTAIPAATHRGGSYGSGSGAGVYAFDINGAPTFWQPLVGFRCAIPK